jgi:hypothetical protein
MRIATSGFRNPEFLTLSIFFIYIIGKGGK